MEWLFTSPRSWQPFSLERSHRAVITAGVGVAVVLVSWHLLRRWLSRATIQVTQHDGTVIWLVGIHPEAMEAICRAAEC